MALPPKDDLRRPMVLACRSMTSVGALLLLLSACTIAPLFYRFNAATVRPTRLLTLRSVISFVIYVAPGIACVVLPIFIRRRAVWAVIVSIVLLSLITAVFLIGFIGAIILAFFSSLNAPGASLPLLIGLGILLLIIIALGQTIYFLARSFPALRMQEWGTEGHGFEPLMMQPANEISQLNETL